MISRTPTARPARPRPPVTSRRARSTPDAAFARDACARAAAARPSGHPPGVAHVQRTTRATRGADAVLALLLLPELVRRGARIVRPCATPYFCRPSNSPTTRHLGHQKSTRPTNPVASETMCWSTGAGTPSSCIRTRLSDSPTDSADGSRARPRAARRGRRGPRRARPPPEPARCASSSRAAARGRRHRRRRGRRSPREVDDRPRHRRRRARRARDHRVAGRTHPRRWLTPRRRARSVHGRRRAASDAGRATVGRSRTVDPRAAVDASAIRTSTDTRRALPETVVSHASSRPARDASPAAALASARGGRRLPPRSSTHGRVATASSAAGHRARRRRPARAVIARHACRGASELAQRGREAHERLRSDHAAARRRPRRSARQRARAAVDRRVARERRAVRRRPRRGRARPRATADDGARRRPTRGAGAGRQKGPGAEATRALLSDQLPRGASIT